MLTSLRKQIAAAPQDSDLRKDLETQLEVAQEMEGKEKDIDHGSVGDALVFRGADGLWRAVLHLDEDEINGGQEKKSETGNKGPIDLRKRTPLREYRVAQETDLFGCLSPHIPSFLLLPLPYLPTCPFFLSIILILLFFFCFTISFQGSP